MQLPEDTPQKIAPPPDSAIGNLVDDAPPPVTSQQREHDFSQPFVWRQKEVVFSVASEMYYRDFRVLSGAPPLGSYLTTNDFSAEAARVIYCSTLSAKDIRALRLLPLETQLEVFDQWVAKNILLHELTAATKLARAIGEAIERARTQPMESEEGDLDGMGNLPPHP